MYYTIHSVIFFIAINTLLFIHSISLEGNLSTKTSSVLTQKDQHMLTPDSVISLLKEGNQRFEQGSLTQRNHKEQVRKASLGQHPKAFLLSCVDSRVTIEDIFDQGIGDVFVARIAGNIVNPDILGSMEYGCAVAKSKVVVVVGHEHCGAVKAAIDKVKLGNLTKLLDKIQPAIQELADYKGKKNSKNKDFIHEVCIKNIHLTIQNIREQSPILNKLEQEGEIKIVGALYKMDTGKVIFL